MHLPVYTFHVVIYVTIITPPEGLTPVRSGAEKERQTVRDYCTYVIYSERNKLCRQSLIFQYVVSLQASLAFFLVFPATPPSLPPFPCAFTPTGSLDMFKPPYRPVTAVALVLAPTPPPGKLDAPLFVFGRVVWPGSAGGAAAAFAFAGAIDADASSCVMRRCGGSWRPEIVWNALH